MKRFQRALFLVAGLLTVVTGWSAVSESADRVTRWAEALLRDANKFWSQQFVALGAQYRAPRLTLFSQTMIGACGAQGALTGPFYCPVDQQVYLDQAFLDEVMQQTPSVGDLAIAYVIGHEVGHHVQNLLGTTALVEQARSRSTREVSARTWATAELQIDCYAGLWVSWAARSGEIKLGADISAALDAVAAVSQQRQAHLAAGQLMVDPLLTYVTAAQRLKWFRLGLDGGQFNDCDTFRAEAAGKL